MFGISALADVPRALSGVYTGRLQTGKLPAGYAELRGPVGLFVVREDGSCGSQLAKEVAGSYGYWDSRSKHYFDGVFLGWGFDGPGNTGQTPPTSEPPGAPKLPRTLGVFMVDAFEKCVADLESEIDWQYRGRSHLLLTDFVYDTKRGEGCLDFSRTIPVDLSKLLDKKQLPQLSELVDDMIAPVRDQRGEQAETSVWEISDYVALLRTREFWWKELVKKMGALLGWVDAVAPYAVRDLRKSRKAKPPD